MNEMQSQYRAVKKDIIVFHNKNEVQYISSPHLHSSYEIYYNISGAKGFMLNGEFYKCGERDLIVVPKGWAHKVLVKKNVEYERCIVNINDYAANMTEIISSSKNVLGWLKGEVAGIPKIVNLTKQQHKIYIDLVEKYNKTEKNEDKLMSLSVFFEIMSFLKGCFENPIRTEYLEDEELSYSDKVMRVIERDFKTATVADIAAKIFMNEDYANRIFKEETGTTIKQYLLMRKLAETKKYLFLGKSIKEACVLSGFHDYANFMRIFKKYEGYSPKELEDLTDPI